MLRRSLLVAICLSPLMTLALGDFGAQASNGTRISGPIVNENLAIYFIHGPSTPGKVPLTLEEALAKGAVRVRETGSVNQLEIENLGAEDIFVQSGDIVKGGRQDRVLMVSLVLPPKSGPMPIASFCVEQGRWSARGAEDSKNFSTASASVPSREMKLAMKAPLAAKSADLGGHPSSSAPMIETSERQYAVWEGVRQTQEKLAGSLGAPVKSAESASSLQLALENEKLTAARQSYVKALKAAGEASDDIVGYVFAVNGKLNSADVYPSNGLFRKMWAKLLTASATEAIGQKDQPSGELPSIEAVTAFLAAAESGAKTEKLLNAGMRTVTRDADKAYLFETAQPNGWVHRNYLAK